MGRMETTNELVLRRWDIRGWIRQPELVEVLDEVRVALGLGTNSVDTLVTPIVFGGRFRWRGRWT